ncbi:hypothetical protein F891_00884 [Acinetobacter sp. CIP 101966]|uniref:hypothetical protein n=1 Tax=Acinetobacter sp. CIP 101966 TaxID=1144662 RepID=UPI0002CDEE3C|nr:hypothetical protein [Acinetobacter sp. CIP 101966]ENX28967.1 hypothetical protein F891_00884 [Acinetobacter sp. CIP 101966]
MLFRILNTGLSSSKIAVIAGQTREMGVVKSKTIRIYNRSNGALLKQIKSDADGYYKAYLPYDLSYLIVGIDENKIFNATVQDNVRPK